MPLSRRKLLKWTAKGAVGIVGLSALDAFAIEPRFLDLERITVPIRDLPAPFEGYRIAFVTDIHYPRNTSRDYIRRAVELGNSIRPDLYLFGGDFVEGGRFAKSGERVPNLSGLLEGANAPDGVFAVLGNHDWSVDGDATRAEVERVSRARFLDNASVRLRRGGEEIALAGLEDLWCRRPDLDVALAGIPEEMPRLLLSHNPDTAEATNGSGRVDLQISGHTHGGEIVIPFYGPPYLPSRYGTKFAQGLVRGALHRVYVSRGIASPRRARFNCRPEVTAITLTRA